MTRPRGMALGTILMIVLVALLLLVTAASTSIFQLSFSVSKTRGDHAQNLAESALSLAMARMADSGFSFGQSPSDRVSLALPEFPNSEGLVTFNPSELPGGHSTYNLESDTSRLGARGRVVPSRTVHLVARGRVGDTERWMEAIYYRPPFPDGMVCQGRAEASGLFLAATRTPGAYTGGDPSQIPAGNRLPGNLFSNDSVAFGANCRITGSVGSTGAIDVAPDTIVEGEVSPNTSARTVPVIDVADKIASFDLNSDTLFGSYAGDLDLPDHWFAQRNGDLDVGGNLNLHHSVLTVRGNLTIQGSLVGVGLVLVDGDVTVLDGADLSTENQVAVAATGRVLLRSSSKLGNFFQGLIYTDTDLTAREITIVGAVVSQGPVTLENVRLVQSPASVVLAVAPPEGRPSDDAVAVHMNVRLGPAGERLYDVTAHFSSKNNLQNPFDITQWAGSTDYATNTWLGLTETQLLPTVDQWVRSVDTAVQLPETYANLAGLVQSQVQRLNGTNAPTVVSFNLNNLLAEQLDRSRILLWRPFAP